MKLSIIPTALVLAAALFAGCSGAEYCGSGACFAGPSDEDGSVSFSLSAADSTVRSFSIRLYKDASDYNGGDIYFESGCSGISKGFTISHVDVDDGYIVEYLGYSDKACTASALVRMGVRGGVRITAVGTGYSYYYIQLNRIGDFTAMPLPDASLNPVSGGVACETDADCRRVIPCPDPDECRFKVTVDCEQSEIDAGDCADGVKVMQYNVHPRAVCDDLVCRLETLFPLNSRGQRAFAACVSTDLGDVLSVGGFTAVSDNSYVVQGASDEASAPETQVFLGGQGIFGVLEHDRPLDLGLAMSGAAMLDADRLVVVGGTSRAGIETVDGAAGLPIVDSLFCSSDCPVALSSYFYVIDTATGLVDRTQLEEALIPAAVVPVARSTASVYVRGGVSMSEFAGDTGSGASRLSWVCQVSDGNGVSCNEVGPSTPVSRLLPAGVCIKRLHGLCSEYLVLGGADDRNKFAEIYSSSDNSVKVYPATGDVPALLTGAVAFMAGDRIWTVGGTGDVNRSVPASPYSVTVDRDAGVVVLSAVTLSSAETAALARTHHQVTVLSDDETVLVTGGVDESGSITRSAVLLSASGDDLSIVNSGLQMSVARMGHSATLLTGGLFDGGVLISGGLTTLDGRFADGAELYLPAE